MTWREKILKYKVYLFMLKNMINDCKWDKKGHKMMPPIFRKKIKN